MKKFYLHDGKEQQGPFDIMDLKARLIKKETLIWYEGLTEWTTAGQVVELNKMFCVSTPPPFIPIPPKQTISQPVKAIEPEKKKSKKTRNIIITLVIVFVLGLGLFILYQINSKHHGSSDSYQEKVISIEETEYSQPTSYLTADGTYRETFFGDKIKVNCEIKNSASIAFFKDVVVQVTYYSKTKTVLGTNSYVIYEIFPPQTKRTVELKIQNYRNVKAIGWEVTDAAAYRK